MVARPNNLLSNALSLKDTSFGRLIIAFLGKVELIFSVYTWNLRISVTLFILMTGNPVGAQKIYDFENIIKIINLVCTKFLIWKQVLLG